MLIGVKADTVSNGVKWCQYGSRLVITRSEKISLIFQGQDSNSRPWNLEFLLVFLRDFY
jgi:hypothetical protein